jgi:hypothetical protein
VGLVIADPSDGPGVDVDTRYATAIRQTREQGIRVLGYVTTSYGSRALRQIESDVDRWHRWYDVDGIFLDEVSTSSGQITDCMTLFADAKRRKGSRHLVVLNPGTQTLEGFMNACDILLNSESTWRTYRDGYVDNPTWVANYPSSRFWHVVHDCPTESEMRLAVGMALARHAEWIYVTSLTGDNPYRTLPGERYWMAELRLMAMS